MKRVWILTCVTFLAFIGLLPSGKGITMLRGRSGERSWGKETRFPNNHIWELSALSLSGVRMASGLWKKHEPMQRISKERAPGAKRVNSFVQGTMYSHISLGLPNHVPSSHYLCSQVPSLGHPNLPEHASTLPFVQFLPPVICREWPSSSLGSVKLQFPGEAAQMAMFIMSSLSFASFLY